MRRLALLLPLVAALAAPAPADAAPASVRVLECTPSLGPEARTATFEARIRDAGGVADRLQVRFTLQTRTQGELGYRKVAAPGFGVWLTSDRGVDRYSYAKTIVNLAAPASYRMVVRFRWLDEQGETLRTAKRTSAACRQPDLRPDLVARQIDVQPAGDPGLRRYVVALRNTGRTAAAASTLTLRVGALPLLEQATAALEPATTRSIAFTAPPCAPGETLELTVDAAESVDEAHEENILTLPCPPAE
jgi:hypothetical protein